MLRARRAKRAAATAAAGARTDRWASGEAAPHWRTSSGEKPIRPMSCVSGIHDRLIVVGIESPRQCRPPRILASRLACVSTTPLGSLVEPEENWMKAVSPGCARVHFAAATDFVEFVDQKRSRAQRLEGSAVRLALARGEAADALEQPLLGIDDRACCSLRAMRSSLCRCSSLMPGATGTGMMPPSTAAQKASMNGSLPDSSRISLSPGRAPSRCRRYRMPSARSYSSRESDRSRVVLASRGRSRCAGTSRLASISAFSVVADVNGWRTHASARF